MDAKMTYFKAILALLCIGFAATDAHAGEWTFQLDVYNTDSLKCDTCTTQQTVVLDTPTGNAFDSIETMGLRPAEVVLGPLHYRDRYQTYDLLGKIVGNQGEGFDSLYGTRNLRPILHGVAYRGGGNNYYHKDAKRHNNNPLPNDGVSNLCQEGFAGAVYLYRRNWDGAMKIDTCDCVHGGENAFQYYQLDYFDSTHVKEMLGMVHNSIVNDTVGPLYLHCWNGWHASGLISAIILRQYCGYNGQDAVNYWDLGTDGQNKSPRYQSQRDRIKAFTPYAEYAISDSLQDCLCPTMPTDIDSSQLHIDLDHLIMVPEALAVGQSIVCSNIRFKPGSSSFSSSAKARVDLKRIMKALDLHPELIVEIGGYTDNSGSASANKSLSAQRAKTVYNYLVKNGIPKERISYRGYGEARPIVSNRYKSTRALNRRIEVKIVSKGNEDLTKLAADDNPESSTTNSTPVEEEKKPEMTTSSATVEYNIDNLKEHGAQFPKGKSILVPGVKFEPYSSRISDKSNKDLKALLAALKANPEMRIEIGGYTDSSGDKEGNRKISRARAKAVYQYLVDNGIAADRLSYKGYGASNPRYSNKYKSTRAKNRRIEVKIL